MVARDGLTLGELPAGSRVGTGSPRRAAQLHALGLGLDVVGVRGNVDTRIGKVRGGELDAVMLARAGLARIGRLDEVTEVLDPLQMLPAPARVRWPWSAAPTTTWPPTSPGSTTRAPAPRRGRARRAGHPRGRLLGSIGALAEVAEGDDGDELWVRAVALSPDGSLSVRMSAAGDPADAIGVGNRLASEMLADGAGQLTTPAATRLTRPDAQLRTTRTASPADPAEVPNA